jgi:surface protein
MGNMFSYATAFNQPIGAWNTAAVTNMDNMFYGIIAFNQNISGWNVGAVVPKPPTQFSNGSALTAQNSPVWFPPIVLVDTTIKYVGSAAAVPTAASLFIQANPRGTGVEWFAVVKQGMKAAISDYASGTSGPFIPPGQSVAVPFNNIVTTLMTDMSSLFIFKSSFNDLIESWDTGAVTNMSQMFYYATGFNKPIGTWNTSAVTNMSNMFYNAATFNKPIGAWNTAAVTNMSGMFADTTNFNQPIGTWNTGAVTNMYAMFYQAGAFNQPIGTWNTGAVTDMNYMFFNATAFNRDISGWNVANVTPKPPTNFISTTGSALTAQNSPVWVT